MTCHLDPELQGALGNDGGLFVRKFATPASLDLFMVWLSGQSDGSNGFQIQSRFALKSHLDGSPLMAIAFRLINRARRCYRRNPIKRD